MWFLFIVKTRENGWWGWCFRQSLSVLREFWRFLVKKWERSESLKAGFCNFPDIDREQLMLWSRSSRLPDGSWKIFRVWSQAISDLARDPLKIFSSLTSPWSRAKSGSDRDLSKNFSSLTSPWSRAKIVKARDPLKISSSLTWCWSRAKIMKDRDPLKKFLLWLYPDREQK